MNVWIVELMRWDQHGSTIDVFADEASAREDISIELEGGEWRQSRLDNQMFAHLRCEWHEPTKHQTIRLWELPVKLAPGRESNPAEANG